MDRVGQLAGDVAERPVGRVGRPAEQRQRGDETDVGQRQVADVVVGDRLGAQLTMPDDDAEDQRVADDADDERQQVRRPRDVGAGTTSSRRRQQVRREDDETRHGRRRVDEDELCE